jgi:2-amino-4-hydroxy-6-hydroxymethyldihydropteridine diphosphokinase
LRRRAYIGLGANLGDAADTLDAAVQSLRSLEQSEVVAVSPLYKSAPVDASGPDFINAVVAIDTGLEPYGLLLHLLDLELMLGRKRRSGDRKNQPRKVDLDLLLLGDLAFCSTPLRRLRPSMSSRSSRCSSSP